MINILWADDQLDVAKSFVSYLNIDDCAFEFACSGNEALDKISEKNYDIILVDLAMPPDRWGGLWLLQKIKELNIDVVSIVVSGEGTQSETIKALRLGASDYIIKDKLLTELPAQIKSSLNVASKVRKEMLELIKAGESGNIEFKSTLRMNLHTRNKDSDIELSVLKTIAGFLNAEGGKLMVGVADSGELLGIENDEFLNNDKFHLHFWNIFKASLGVEHTQLIKTEFVEVDNKSIFFITCFKSASPIFIKWKLTGNSQNQEFFYVRVGPQTEQLGTRQAIEYINNHFKE